MPIINHETRDNIIRATFAYHLHPREHLKAHCFNSSLPDATCKWCGRTRHEVRWGAEVGYEDNPPECIKRPANTEFDVDIHDVILAEEKRFEALLSRAEKLSKEQDLSRLSGAELCKLHHTNGIDPSILESIGVSISQVQHDEYMAEYSKHKATGKAGEKKQEIKICQ